MGDRIQKTIDNLKALSLDGDSNENLSAICDVLYGGKPDFGWTKGACEWLRDALVGLLEQHDPDEWSDKYLDEVGIVRLPKDADGETIRIGDVMECDRLLNGNRVCGEVKAIGDGIVWLHNIHAEYLLYAKYLHHHHTPTVPEILNELEGLRGTGDYEDVVTRAAELAGQLRELMQNE